MRNLNEGKKKSPSYMAELSEIDKQSAVVAMEAKINHLQEMADKKKEKLKMVSEDENLSELIDPKRKKMMEREIKEIEKAKLKLEKLYEKSCGSKPKEMVDEDARTDAEEEGYLDGMKDEKEDMEEGYSTPPYEEDDLGEGYSTPSYEEDDTDPMNEEFLRMQKLSGIITEEEYKNKVDELNLGQKSLGVINRVKSFVKGLSPSADGAEIKQGLENLGLSTTGMTMYGLKTGDAKPEYKISTVNKPDVDFNKKVKLNQNQIDKGSRDKIFQAATVSFNLKDNIPKLISKVYYLNFLTGKYDFIETKTEELNPEDLKKHSEIDAKTMEDETQKPISISIQDLNSRISK